MNAPNQPESDRELRVATLLQRYFDRVVSEAEAAELLGLMECFPEMVESIRENCELHDLFRYRETRRKTLPLVLPAPRVAHPDMDALARQAVDALPDLVRDIAVVPRKAASPVPAKPSTLPKPLLISVAALLLFFGVLIFQEWRPGSESPVDHIDIADTPAVVVNMDEVRWHGDIKPPRLGEPLPPGTLRFEAGSIELLTFKGVRGVVEGPAELVLLNDFQIFCKRGRWSVTVPPQGKGFEIQTPTLTLRDLGTEFYAAIEPEKCDLHVLRGSVELERPDGAKTLFRTGEGTLFRRGDRQPEPIAAEPGHFVTRREMRRRSDAVLFPGGLPDLASPQTPTVEAFRTVDFGRQPVADATLHGGELVDGPAPGTRAFRFTGPGDRLQLKPAGTPNSMTAVVSLRIDRLSSEMNPILMSDGADDNGLVWHVMRKGAMIVGVRSASGLHGKGILETPIVLSDDRLGRWIRLALVVDGPARRLTAYVDGDPVFSKTLTRTVRANLNRLGIGCWQPAGEGGVPRQLDGAIERVLIFDRALSLNEIRTVNF